MLITHYIGNPVAHKQKVGIVCGIANFFSLSLGQESFYFFSILSL